MSKFENETDYVKFLLEDLRKVRGIGDKTIERIKEQLLQNGLDDNYKSEYNPSIKLDVNEIHQGD